MGGDLRGGSRRGMTRFAGHTLLGLRPAGSAGPGWRAVGVADFAGIGPGRRTMGVA